MLASFCLLAGCAAPGGSLRNATVVDPARSDHPVLRIEGPSRVVLRTGETERARQFEVRDGTATWWRETRIEDWRTKDGLYPRERRVVPLADLSAVQVRVGAPLANGAGGAITGLLFGALTGAAIAGPGQLGEVPVVVSAGLTGVVVGGAIGAARSEWADRYVFEPSRAPLPGGAPCSE